MPFGTTQRLLTFVVTRRTRTVPPTKRYGTTADCAIGRNVGLSCVTPAPSCRFVSPAFSAPTTVSRSPASHQRLRGSLAPTHPRNGTHRHQWRSGLAEYGVCKPVRDPNRRSGYRAARERRGSRSADCWRRRRSAILATTARLVPSLDFDQVAISSRVRRHPMHNPVDDSILQMPTQGDATSGASTCVNATPEVHTLLQRTRRSS